MIQVVSVCVAGIISLALLVHFCFAFNRPQDDEPPSVRSSGRKFMLSVTIFLSIIALQSLIFSRLENWSYSDGIYFSIQTALTIGYGDYTPSTTAGKVLVFPFAILTISQLGNEISLIVDFIRVRSRERRTVWRKKYEGAIHREAELLKPRATLLEEMRLVHEINKREAW
jgi:potassium channel subfamily K